MPNRTTKDNLRDRFWNKVLVAGPNDCWEWTGSRFPDGYGQLRVNYRLLHANRIAWELIYGSVPSGQCVCHRCDNPPCVNPAHLWIGSRAENTADRDHKGRRTPPRGSTNGFAKLTEGEIPEIRHLHASGMFQRDIARKYGVHQHTIWRIVNRVGWTHV